MNLHNLVSGVIGSINPHLTVQYKQSIGYATGADGTQSPGYADPVSVLAQKQPLTNIELTQVEAINQGGEKCALYINGTWNGVVRPQAKGGDLFILPDDSEWLVVIPLESWGMTAGWTKVAAVRQT